MVLHRADQDAVGTTEDSVTRVTVTVTVAVAVRSRVHREAFCCTME
jgi:hypothetical protein